MERAGSTARFALPGQPTMAMLVCETPGRTTKLWRTGGATGPVPLVVTTTGTRRILDAAPETAGGTAASLAVNDPLLDAIAFSRGRFMLETPGNPPLYLPSWPELARVVEDCRRR